MVTLNLFLCVGPYYVIDFRLIHCVCFLCIVKVISLVHAWQLDSGNGESNISANGENRDQQQQFSTIAETTTVEAPLLSENC